MSILLSFIEQEIDQLISDFQKTFPQSELLTNKKSKLVDVIYKCFEAKKITESHTAWIHSEIAAALGIETTFKKIIKSKNEDYADYIMRKYGDEFGSVILLSQKAITTVARKIVAYEQNA
jgi:hypothetical protein